MTIDDGGPAFPVHGGDSHDDPRNRILGGGMSLLDWPAGQALGAVITAMQSGYIGDHPDAGGGPQGYAATCYDIADAMLAARAKGGVL